jgi:hypothetical protein
MYQYQEIINHLEIKKDWIDEQDFFVHQLFEVSFKILARCYEDLMYSNKILLFPYLRQIKENTFFIFGFEENVLDVIEFIKGKTNQKQIIERIEAKEEYREHRNLKIINNYYNALIDPLNDFTHSNFQTLMMHFTERLNDEVSDKYYEAIVSTFIFLIETPLVVMYNSKFKTHYDIPNIKNIEDRIVKLKNLRHVLYKQNDPNVAFINRSENIRNFYMSKLETVMHLLHELKDLQT